MTTALMYGRFEKPAQRQEILVDANPLETLRAAYQQWASVAKMPVKDIDSMSNNLKSFIGFFSPQSVMSVISELNTEALQLLRPQATILNELPGSQLDRVVQEISDDSRLSGIFLSALLQATDIKMLAGEFEQVILGYELPEGKIIVAEKGSIVNCLGYESRGVLVNCGLADTMSAKTQEGIAVNRRHVEMCFGNKASGGVHLNSAYAHGFPRESTGGTFLNFGSSGLIYSLHGLVYANFNPAQPINTSPTDNIVLDFADTPLTDTVKRLPADAVSYFEKTAREARHEMSFLQEDEGAEVLRRKIAEYDWQSLESRVNLASAKILEAAK